MEDFKPLIALFSSKYVLDPNLVIAIIIVESGGNSWAARYEPNWKYFYYSTAFAESLKITQITELMMQGTSWGPMQIMGSVARELGFKDELQRLCIPDIGIEYGCKKLADLSKKYANEEDIISCYNAGSIVKTLTGTYHNFRYVDSVYQVLRKLRC